MPRPLSERRAALETLIGRRTSPVFISRRLVRDGKAAYREAKRLGWEGIIAKDERSPYQPGVRSPFWRKVKVRNDSEFVIGGCGLPEGGRHGHGAVLVGVQAGPGLGQHGTDGSGLRPGTHRGPTPNHAA